MLMDSLFNVSIKGTLKETTNETTNLTSIGDLEVINIIEGTGWNLDEYGNLTVTTIKEGGLS
jgi:hypothetical protein